MYRHDMTPSTDESTRSRPTLWQRMALRNLRRAAGRPGGEPLSPEDWELAWRLHEYGLGRVATAAFRALPHGPRCVICGAPFAGAGRWVVGPLGFRPSRKNPTVCATCVEASPPGGMTQHVGILFADLRGFTSFAEDRAAEQVIEVLNAYHDAVSDAILRHGGALVSIMGDGVMAVFGAPIPADDHADRAGRAARDMVTGLAGFNAWLAERGLGDGFRLGIGVHAGPVMSGNVGGRNRLEYTVIGDTTNVASRLEALTKDHEADVLISREVRDRLAAASLEGLELVGELRVRGRRASIEAWTLR